LLQKKSQKAARSSWEKAARKKRVPKKGHLVRRGSRTKKSSIKPSSGEEKLGIYSR